MENNIFSFIIYSQSSQLYNECVEYINELLIPKNYSIEIIRVNEGKSIASAYNYGLKESKGKYKIYMDEDVCILNKNILIDSLNIFDKDENISVIGIVGSKDISPNGVWWEGKEKYGKVVESSTGDMKPLHFIEVNSEYEEVSLIDEMIMITKNDISFRDDILEGNFFHASMYCIDILLLGKKIVVPKQESYWIMHNCGVVNLDGYDNDKNIFIKNYSDKVNNAYSPYKDITISLCMIVKNEEKILPRCINLIKNAIDEIIIVDTGSSDDTVNIAKELGCIVYNYEWIDNFGDARNFAFSKATKDYIMWLDADDIVTEENTNKIINIKNNFNTQIDSINMRYVLSEDANGNEGFVLKRNRIVKRSNGFKWIGFIHEYLEVYGNIYYSDIS
ncbi:MAG: glycosyltransferase, partial [Paraclostridium sp.]